MKKIIEKDFDAVKYMRSERDKISKEIAEMTHEEIKEYFAKRRSLNRISNVQSNNTRFDVV